MSASLVGSEMCIRDRSGDIRSVLAARGLVAAARFLHAIARQRVRGPAPVSYTHLTLPTICSV
eukprot:4512072-Alexandrium_andersonii.AAC.1